MASHKLHTIFFTFFSVVVLTALYAVNSFVSASTIQADDVVNLDNGAAFHKTKCWFEFANKDIDCGWLETAPLESSTTSAFQLPVVVFRYTGADKQDDPIIYLAGGPGAGAWLGAELIQSFWQSEWKSKISKLKRDLVLFDQRGSGLSQPVIRCPQYAEHVENLLLHDNTPFVNADLYREATIDCQQGLKKAGAPINQLATRYSAQDVVDIMTALGYEKWNIQSVSYGTRLGIEVQRRYPEKVRTLLLDSVYPPSANLSQDWPILLNNSLNRMFTHCATDTSCAASAVDYQKRFWVLMESLKRRPITLEINSPDSKLDRMILNDQTLLAVIFHAEYRTDILSYLNDAVFELEKGKIDSIQPFVEDYISNLFDGSFSNAVYWAVECHDNPEIDLERYAEDEARYTRLSPYLLKDKNICDVWNQDYTYIPLNAEKQIGTPVLIFSGEDDPITPSNWAIDSAAEFDNNAYLFSFYGVSHSVLDNKHCATELYSNFVNNPDKRPRANCRVGDNRSYDEESDIATDDDNEQADSDSMEVVTEKKRVTKQL